MKINLKDIRKLKPCQNRLDNYLSYYGTREFTPNQFMGLKNITHQDKLWVAFRLMPKESLGKAAAEIALSVLPIYEKQYPHDYRPRRAIEACIAGTNVSQILETRKVCEAWDASLDAADIFAVYAARSAAYAGKVSEVILGDRAAINALCSATYAVSASAYSPGACSVEDREYKEKLIRKICLKYWKR